MSNTVTVIHNAGFFSCCSVRLHHIVAYINKNKKLPDKVISTRQFHWYKPNNRKKDDITFEYFRNYDGIKLNNIQGNYNYNHEYQFCNYSTLDYGKLVPLVRKYFSPSRDIERRIKFIEDKYRFDYNNTCVLFYRGNDKNRETRICGYNEYIRIADNIKKDNPDIRFLIQSDETGFIETMKAKYENSFYFKDEIRHMKKCNSTVDMKMRNLNYEFSKFYLAITIIMSRCKQIVCGTGNCSIWIMFYRGHNNGVYQNRDGVWIYDS